MQHSRGKAKGVRTMTGEAAALSAAKYAPATCDDELHKETERGGGSWIKKGFGGRGTVSFWQHVALLHVCAMLLLLLLLLLFLLYCFERAHQFLAKFKLNKKPKGSQCVPASIISKRGEKRGVCGWYRKKKVVQQQQRQGFPRCRRLRSFRHEINLSSNSHENKKGAKTANAAKRARGRATVEGQREEGGRLELKQHK